MHTVVWSPLVHGRVDKIASRIRRSRRITASHAARQDLEAYHVASRQHAEVSAQRIHPHQAWMLRVSH